jgi:hypothetical protein
MVIISEICVIRHSVISFVCVSVCICMRSLTFIILAHRGHLIPQRTHAPQLVRCGHLNAPYTHVDA